MILNGAAWIRHCFQRFPKGINRWDEKKYKVDRWNEQNRSIKRRKSINETKKNDRTNGMAIHCKRKIWNQIVNRATKW